MLTPTNHITRPVKQPISVFKAMLLTFASDCLLAEAESAGLDPFYL